ncbi:MAG: hypothetical protein HY081_00515, partial [Gammaproteobacteria bacterium]|nr:hypothetical protein [Gammaproteobacteria bacterium]
MAAPALAITNYSYDTTGRLNTVTDVFGHSLTLGYNTGNHIATVTDSTNKVISYTYGSNNNLTRVDYPDATAKLYHYENPALPNHLTGISFVDSVATTTRYSTYNYYYNSSNTADPNNGKAILTQHAVTTNGTPQEKFLLTYNTDTQTTVTDPLNMSDVLTFSTNLGVKNLVNKVNQSDNKSVAQVFDPNNNLTCKKDEANHVTLSTYSTTNQKLSTTEGLALPPGGDCNTCLSNPAACNVGGTGRVTTYEYLSPTLDLVRFIRRPSVAVGQTFETELVYADTSHPNLPTQIIQRGFTPTATPVSRTVNVSYNANGQVTSLNGPRTDVNDVTTLSYY